MFVQRYWYQLDKGFDLDGCGFLVDPTGPFGQIFAPNARPYEEIEREPVLILLGEPGMGKSTEIARISKGRAEGSLPPVAINLREFATDARLEQKLSSHPSLIAWKQGDGNLLLLFDSLEESPIPNVASIVPALLRDVLRTKDGYQDGEGEAASVASGDTAMLPNHSRGEIFIRIACRSGAFVHGMLDSLKSLAGVNDVAVYKLGSGRGRDSCFGGSAQGIISAIGARSRCGFPRGQSDDLELSS